MYKLDSFNPDNWAVFYIQNEDPAIMIPEVNGVQVTAITNTNDGDVDWTKYKDQCGANVFNAS